MSRICFIHTAHWGEGLKYTQKLFDMLRKNGSIKPDTEFDIKPIDKATESLTAYTESWYFELMQRQYVVESAIQAEKSGYDAAIINCYFDPGVDEAREVVNIPVVGVAEASFSFAHMFAMKKRSVAIIAIAQKGILKTLDVIDKYGFNSQLIPERPLRQILQETYTKAATTGKAADIQALKDEFTKVARECIRDGAEVIIPGCGGLGPLLAIEGLLEIDGALVLDCVTCGIKMAENLIDLRKSGISVSRRLMYRQLPVEDFEKERRNFGYSRG